MYIYIHTNIYIYTCIHWRVGDLNNVCWFNFLNRDEFWSTLLASRCQEMVRLRIQKRRDGARFTYNLSTEVVLPQHLS